MPTMQQVTSGGTRLEQLKTLAICIAQGIDECDDVRTLPQLARQYRETIREIAALEDDGGVVDELAAILERRKPAANVPGGE